MSNEWQVEYDQRQYALMGNRLTSFVENKLDIGSLIDNIKALLSTLEQTDQAWIDKVQNEWWTLEMIYAFALDQKEQGLVGSIKEVIDTPSNIKLISEATQKMRRLIQDRTNSKSVE